MILLLTSRPSTETETLLKEISSQITEIEATEKKIEHINNFLDESLKKEKEQKLEKLAGVLDKKKNELLASGLGKITKQPKLSHYDIIKNFIQTFKTDYKNNKEKTIDKLNRIVFELDQNNNATIATTKKELEKLIFNLNLQKEWQKQESIIDKIITEFNNLIQ